MKPLQIYFARIGSHFSHLLAMGCVFMLLAVQVFSQRDKVAWENNVILVNGKPYAKMERKASAILTYDYSVSGLTGPEVLYLKAYPGEYINNPTYGSPVRQWYHEYNFIGSGGKASVKYLSNSDNVAKAIVENKLILNNKVDADAERRFIQLNNGYTPTDPITTPTVVVNVNNGVVDGEGAAKATDSTAKSSSPIALNGNSILRNGVVVGKFRDVVAPTAYTEKQRTVTIYTDGGEKVAEATAPVADPQEWKVRLIAENKEMDLFYDSPTELESLFKWMSDKGYIGKN